MVEKNKEREIRTHRSPFVAGSYKWAALTTKNTDAQTTETKRLFKVKKENKYRLKLFP